MPPDDPATPDVGELERLAKAATPNLYRGDATADSLYQGDYALIAPENGHGGRPAVWCQFNPHFVFGPDAELFVNARAAVLTLITGFRALTADRDAHRAAAQEAEAERDALRRAVEKLRVAWADMRAEDRDFAIHDAAREVVAALAPAAPLGDAGTTNENPRP